MTISVDGIGCAGDVSIFNPDLFRVATVILSPSSSVAKGRFGEGLKDGPSGAVASCVVD